MIRTFLGFSSTISAVVLAASLVATGPAEAMEDQFSAFKQAVAEAAANDRDIAAFYRSNEFGAVWTGTGEADRARRAALFAAMENAAMHGLPPARYDTDRLMRILSDVRGPRERGEAEVELTKAFIGLARDMQSGVLEPGRVDGDIKREGVYRDASTYLAGISESDRPRAYIRSLVPQTREYARLMKEKLRLKGLIETGGWGRAVPARALQEGDRGDAVVALRDRLMKMGYLPRTSTMVYDANIAKAVREFQAAHGLEADGTAGSATITQINRSPEQRLISVIVAMERERWLNKERGSRHILVNLTDFSARIIDNDRITFETRAVVGANSSDRRSPEFSDVMEHLVINPRWNVPRSIAVNEYLPKMQRNPGAAGHLRLYDASGRQVSRANVNFSAYTRNTFPFNLVQPPSDSNALGLVKFMFPNRYNIYLHDTPSKHLFAHARRAYSHGCIRLAQPFDFAYQILARQEENPKEFFHRVLETGQETQVDLEQEIPVHIIYRTAFTDAKGRAQYRPDVYGRDARIWAALQNEGVAPEILRYASLPNVQPEAVAEPRATNNTQRTPQPQTRRVYNTQPVQTISVQTQSRQSLQVQGSTQVNSRGRDINSRRDR